MIGADYSPPSHSRTHANHVRCAGTYAHTHTHVLARAHAHTHARAHPASPFPSSVPPRSGSCSFCLTWPSSDCREIETEPSTTEAPCRTEITRLLVTLTLDRTPIVKCVIHFGFTVENRSVLYLQQAAGDGIILIGRGWQLETQAADTAWDPSHAHFVAAAHCCREVRFFVVRGVHALPVEEGARYDALLHGAHRPKQRAVSEGRARRPRIEFRAKTVVFAATLR